MAHGNCGGSQPAIICVIPLGKLSFCTSNHFFVIGSKTYAAIWQRRIFGGSLEITSTGKIEKMHISCFGSTMQEQIRITIFVINTQILSHRIHGAGIYANIRGILMGSMLPYIAYMDPMGIDYMFFFHQSPRRERKTPFAVPPCMDSSDMASPSQIRCGRNPRNTSGALGPHPTDGGKKR